MPCENQKSCDFYQKMLPLFKEVLYDKLPQFNSGIDMSLMFVNQEF